MGHQLRLAALSDEPFLREMLYLALFVRPGEPPFPRSILQDNAIAHYINGWGTMAGDVGWIALLHEEPIGAAWLRRFSVSDPGYGFVDAGTPELSMAVLPRHRGKGVGSSLLARLLADAPAVSLSCDPANRARQLYRRFGFEPLPGGDKMIRTTSLQPPA